jgi:hypothetical protein
MITQHNVANLLIVKNDTKTLTHSHNIDTDLAGMFNGESVVMSPGGIIVNAAGTLPTEFKIATKLSDGTLNYSDTIKANKIKSINATRAAGATQQLDYIGYNGVSGAIDLINSNWYTARLYMKPTDIAGFAQQRVKTASYLSDSSATQAKVAVGLASALLTQLSREPETIKYGTNNIKVEMVYSGAGTVVTNAVTVTAASKGSKVLAVSADNHGLVAGTFVRIGGTALTQPVYVVDSVATGSVTLTTPYQGANGTVANASFLSAAAAGDWGIKLTGSTFKFDAPKFNYLLPRWVLNLQDCGVTTVTNSAGAKEGDGTYEEIASMEQLLQGNEGNFYRAQVPYPTFRTEAVSTVTYGMIVIEFVNEMGTTLGDVETSYKQLYLACAKPATGSVFTDANTGLCVTLQSYLTANANITSNVASLATEIAA